MDPILDKTETFIDLMTAKAASGETFCLDTFTTNLVFDIIGVVTFSMDLDAQQEGRESAVLLTYRALSDAFNKRPFGGVGWRDYFSANEREIRRQDKELDAILKSEIRKQHTLLQSPNTATDKPSTHSRSVASLSLTGIDKLTPQILQQTSDTLRGFLFAGHDTTSILLQWLFYELHTHPSAASTLASELTNAFGPDPSPSAVISLLRSPETSKTVLSQLPYTDALIKETLRLHPPGTTARLAPPNSNTTLTLPSGDSLLVDGLCLSPRSHTIHRQPSIYGPNADAFDPARWLGERGRAIPESSFRPYERGPRRCTGSELANLEAKIVVACVARWFEFEKVGLGAVERGESGEVLFEEEDGSGEGRVKTKGRLFNTHKVTARPVDGMEVRIKIKGNKGE